jgi:Bifunctional DNA primase/polymerase, N-terminal
MNILEYFDLYTNKLEWNVIVINPNSKSPVFKKWNGGYRPDWHRFFLETHNDYNIGILLGRIIDVEADDEQADKLLNSLIGNTPHPQYRSAKSTHHLFLTPNYNLTRTVIQGIEFRGYKHQSLLPPSISPTGLKYEWLKKSSFPVPAMPKQLRKFYKNNERRNKLDFLPRSASRNERISYLNNLEKSKLKNLYRMWRISSFR